MTPLRKLMIIPWFGPLPEWFPSFIHNVAHLEDYGYRFLLDHDLERFKYRVSTTLNGIEAPIVPGGTKIHDYRATLGLLYQEELQGYDFWGHSDLDCVYGRIDKFVPDSLLHDLDIFTNHTYICGPWTLYRNDNFVNYLFAERTHWRNFLTDPNTNGWVELEYTDVVKAAVSDGRLRAHFTTNQVWDAVELERLTLDSDNKLKLDGREVMMAHFRHTKVYPPRCR